MQDKAHAQCIVLVNPYSGFEVLTKATKTKLNK